MARPRKTENELRMRGMLRRDRRAGRSPNPPNWLVGEARRDWEIICEVLSPGTLTKAESDMLAGGCAAYRALGVFNAPNAGEEHPFIALARHVQQARRRPMVLEFRCYVEEEDQVSSGRNPADLPSG